MILICEDSDVRPECRDKPLDELRQRDLTVEAFHASSWAEVVYVLRDDVAQMIKNRNGPFTPEIPVSVTIAPIAETERSM